MQVSTSNKIKFKTLKAAESFEDSCFALFCAKPDVNILDVDDGTKGKGKSLSVWRKGRFKIVGKHKGMYNESKAMTERFSDIQELDGAFYVAEPAFDYDIGKGEVISAEDFLALLQPEVTP